MVRFFLGDAERFMHIVARLRWSGKVAGLLRTGRTGCVQMAASSLHVSE